MEYPKILCIDYGYKKIGLAISDDLNITAMKLGVLKNNGLAISEIVKIINEKKVEIILIGKPSFITVLQHKNVDEFFTELSRQVAADITFVNEDFTTREAKNILLSQNKKKSRLAKQKDANQDDILAAQIMLQSFLSEM